MSDEPKGKRLRSQMVIDINRPAYELKYPSDWKIDTVSEDFGIDNCFSIATPQEDGVSIFIIYNTLIDEEEHVSNQVKDHLKSTTKNGIVSYFDHWGSFKGHGALIKAKIMGVWNGEVKIFCHSGDSCSFVTVSQYLIRSKQTTLPGLQLIESSFKLKR